MSESASELHEALRTYWDSLSGWDEPDFEAEFGARLRAVGAVPLLIEILRKHTSSGLFRWMCAFHFLWVDLRLPEWREVVRGVATDPHALYEAVRSLGELCALDVAALTLSDPAVDDRARDYVRANFPQGGAPPASEAVRAILEEYAIDYEAIWAQLASEGAPMTWKRT